MSKSITQDTAYRQSMMRYEATAVQLGIRHKLIRPYTPRHSGKVERSHREDQKRFCSLDDFAEQLTVHNRRSNNFPMRPLGWLSPSEFTVQYVFDKSTFNFLNSSQCYYGSKIKSEVLLCTRRDKTGTPVDLLKIF